MGKRYEHLSIEEREAIGQMPGRRMSTSKIAEAIGRYKSTVSREVIRNASEQYKRYTPCQAQKRAEGRRKEAGKRYRLKTHEIRQYVHDGLEKGWFPEIISGRLKVEHEGMIISPPSNYKCSRFEVGNLQCIVQKMRIGAKNARERLLKKGKNYLFEW